jgi:hypothetical protein
MYYTGSGLVKDKREAFRCAILNFPTESPPERVSAPDPPKVEPIVGRAN